MGPATCCSRRPCRSSTTGTYTLLIEGSTDNDAYYTGSIGFSLGTLPAIAEPAPGGDQHVGQQVTGQIAAGTEVNRLQRSPSAQPTTLLLDQFDQ